MGVRIGREVVEVGKTREIQKLFKENNDKRRKTLGGKGGGVGEE